MLRYGLSRSIVSGHATRCPPQSMGRRSAVARRCCSADPFFPQNESLPLEFLTAVMPVFACEGEARGVSERIRFFTPFVSAFHPSHTRAHTRQTFIPCFLPLPSSLFRSPVPARAMTACALLRQSTPDDTLCTLVATRARQRRERCWSGMREREEREREQREQRDRET